MNKLVRKNKKGFTLTEMIVVIAIIGILAAVLIPSVVIYVNKAQQNAAYQEASAAYKVYQVFQTEKEAGLIVVGDSYQCKDTNAKHHTYDANDKCTVLSCGAVKDNNYYDFADYYYDVTNESFNGTEPTGTSFVFTADNGITVTINTETMAATYSR